jgi:hypothetical protein
VRSIPLQFCVENISKVPVTSVALRFDDNTAEGARKFLADGQHPVETVYSIERELIERPVLSWDGLGKDVGIHPGEQLTLNVRCRGKTGW